MAKAMKNSGVEWIGNIPDTWSISKNKYILEWMYSGGTPTASNEEFYAEDGIPFVSIGDMSTTDFVRDTKKKLTEKGVKDKNLIILPVGTILYSIYATIGAVSELMIPAAISQAMLALRLKPSYDKQYYKYNLQAMRDYIFFDANGNTQFNLNAEKVWNFFFVQPPLSVQKQIAKYLDSKCGRIDSVIEQTRASVEEYKKLKQAMITKAVTRGIRPNRTMKDSGVTWIGEIPEDWHLSKVKYVSDFQPRCDTSNLTEDSVITYTPMDCIKNGCFINHPAPLRSVAASLTPYCNGDIVIAKVTPCFENGNIAIMENLYSGYGLGSSELFVLRPVRIHTKFLFYWLQNHQFMQQACATMTGTGGLKRVSPYFVRNSAVALPGDDEQQEIAAYLDEKTHAIETLIAKKGQFVSELESYKKSLIYEYVTGKKEVS